MIQANELMIGNLFIDELTNNVLKVSSLSFDKVEFTVLNRTDFPLPIGWKASPIPTTEEWLVDKFGFNKDYKKGWIGIDVKHYSGMTTDFILAEPFSMGEWQSFYAFVYDKHRFVKLEFVHQVQNLFHAMTHKELCPTNK